MSNGKILAYIVTKKSAAKITTDKEQKKIVYPDPIV